MLFNETIEYREEIPTAKEFHSLYTSTEWDSDNTKTADCLYYAIKSSWYFISAYHNDNLIAVGRVISDGYLHAFIVDLIVYPEYQGTGIGSEILDRLVNHTIKSGISDIQLFCAKGKKEFYLKNNFSERLSEAPGMQFNN